MICIDLIMRRLNCFIFLYLFYFRVFRYFRRRLFSESFNPRVTHFSSSAFFSLSFFRLTLHQMRFFSFRGLIPDV